MPNDLTAGSLGTTHLVKVHVPTERYAWRRSRRIAGGAFFRDGEVVPCEPGRNSSEHQEEDFHE